MRHDVHTPIDPASHDAPAAARWRRALVYLPPALLTIVALQQIVLTKTSSLVPWKGGGFGMFSSVDSERSRMLRAFVLVDDRSYAVVGSIDALGLAVGKAISLPSPGRLNDIAGRLARRTWWLDPKTNTVSLEREGDERRIRVRATAVRVQVFRVLFHSDSAVVERFLLAEATRERQ